MRVAIIGSGISGLLCANLLSRRHQVTVFEASDWNGGHTHTVDVNVGGKDYAIDTGFIVFNDWTYPNFIELLKRLGVASQPTEMSFSVCDPLSDMEYNGNTLKTLFARRRHLISPGFLLMLRDIFRFNREAQEGLRDGSLSHQPTLGEFLDERGYGKRFRDHYIVPMGAAIWSMPLAQMLDFPLEFFLRFFRNHGLLAIKDRPQWRVVCGGSRNYLAPLIDPFKDRIRLATPVSRVERHARDVTIFSSAGEEHFDKVIFACHSDQALALLADPSQAEQEILGAIGYADNEVVLHTDTSLLPQRKLAWASWNYRLGKAAEQPAALTYNMNILQGIDAPETFCVSLNQTDQIDPTKILRSFNYAHPQYTLAAVQAQSRWEELLGKQHSFYCGAYWGNGFHEDGVVSALRVAGAYGESL
ncbi:MAG: FAD-dependent oxidoreductase [Halopseudomonas sp.]|uniref:NAD(P)/FAD-dependent oxidoreductase n=1 Tax=Halopseudomonas sp. TaxID=2901191 RepID=UPI0030027969